MSVLLSDLISCGLDAANRAAAKIREIHSSNDFRIKFKTSETDPVTVADIQSERTITSLFLGEEAAGSEDIGSDFSIPLLNLVKASSTPYDLDDILLFIDPLDGTYDFINERLGNVSILIGISSKSKPIAGIIHFPFMKDSKTGKDLQIWGGVGYGVNGIEQKTLTDEICIVTKSGTVGKYGTEEMSKLFEPAKFVSRGGMGAKIASVLMGEAHVVMATPAHPSSRWDICAGQALLNASGGVLTDIDGNEYLYEDDPLSSLKLTPHSESSEDASHSSASPSPSSQSQSSSLLSSSSSSSSSTSSFSSTTSSSSSSPSQTESDKETDEKLKEIRRLALHNQNGVLAYYPHLAGKFVEKFFERRNALKKQEQKS
ncbi:putative biphosphate nucleotidase [Monocercomonoides exilis]|uniref:putative biphosphate nucleotidase n=1 Tax=Monocercomonoides exilis TaxID=2049356 RepID=UPI00355A326E|nr:putative biphosphate nucleotidase [Monocercomonoides exilis]|eukprot:MONOS_10535.1-p1 / transcript=MONOS_10535.1 / gene=MONOS_10535 / organism=Monocercomonoides_exilis_PA203 / gene_product=biphosphate nucleotidase / transcript_product=biphosphate nucleotidase / location=Mono_scaffold00482:41537-43184(-) / protein_length=371 / sequence_SO=supercontig / SO=protein_coding / is_pseudo=false